jgi:molecular chaperone GrpE (heat shock protein)
MSGDPFSVPAKLLATLDLREEQAALLRSLLDVMDSFDRLLAGGGDAVPAKTVRLLARQLARCLEGAGVEPLRCLGAAVDPESHEIAETRPTADGAEPDTIVEVVSEGYLWNGRMLRRPRVTVASGEKETRA